MTTPSPPKFRGALKRPAPHYSIDQREGFAADRTAGPRASNFRSYFHYVP